MVVKFARCNMVGLDCRFTAKGATDEEVIDQFSAHLKQVHNVEPKALLETLKAVIMTHGGSSASPQAAPQATHDISTRTQPSQRGSDR
jgi:predicted small metal-binding protein